MAKFNNVANMQSIYAEYNEKPNNSIDSQNKKSKDIVYVADGEGSTSAGNGTEKSPYQNIRTALDNIPDGGTLKLLGTVKYTKYEEHTDKSALPLFINKNITIESGNNTSPLDSNADGFALRAPIQLEANVTFKNIRLSMPTQVSLGRNSDTSNSKFLGTPIPRSATIFAAGYELTLDNVNTKVGSSTLQDEDRIYISGGSYKDQEKIGPKAVINVINPNTETKLSAIYAGDYWEERNFDVEINVNCKILENKIYTGGLVKPLNGNVTLNTENRVSTYSIDKTNHNGNVSLNIEKDNFINAIDLTNVDNLSLGENTKLELPKGSKFNINNVTLKNGSVLDFRRITGNPIVNGNFQGYYGSILLEGTQTLDVKGEVLGTTKLNYDGRLYSEPLVKDHKYVTAKANSSGDFTIKKNSSSNLILKKNLNNNKTTWTYTEDTGDTGSGDNNGSNGSGDSGNTGSGGNNNFNNSGDKNPPT